MLNSIGSWNVSPIHRAVPKAVGLRQTIQEVEFLIVAVAVNQTRRRVGRHAAEHEMPGRILWDGEGAAVRAFMAPSTSYVVVLDADGKVAYTGLGDDQDIEAAIAKAMGR